jgi:SAM-dependent methyltransferase
MDSILPLVPGLEEALQSGIDVLDVGCGRGRAVNLLASTFPESRFRGCDPSQERVDHANFRAFAMGLNNVRFQVEDVADLDEPARHDLALDFDAIRHERRPRQVLANIARALRPAGVLLMQEGAALSHPEQTLGLPHDSPLVAAASLAETDTGEHAPAPAGVQGVIGLLLESGFDSAAAHQLPHHLYNCVFVATKGPR